MAAIANLNRTRRQRAATAAAPARAPIGRRMPPSAMLISVVLEYADLRDDMGGGRVMLRLSPMRLAEAEIQAMLADELGRAGDVAVIWDEREDEVFRVLDGGAASPTGVSASLQSEPFHYDQPSDDDRDQADYGEDDELVLTPAAMRYLAEHAARGGRRW
ncbi:hypothetical protein ACO2Q3_23870 [Caulobacter sp. KR2-114]|uniref:hypothetical protein n=1 Tax=Caulobacter sp. KR2-114 TaxID=3400912 RepID=UPI003BFAB726